MVLGNGAWGDIIAMQGVCGMFSITLNVLSTYNLNVISITPSSGTSHGSIYLGLIEQFHYVGLDKVSYSTIVEPDSFEEVLDNVSIEEGGMHTK